MPRPSALLFLFAVALAGCSPIPERAASAPASAERSPAEEFIATVRRSVLPNGLTVLVREQKGTGIVAVNTWVKAGYFHEPDNVAGMAHLFEHMFFKGSKAYPGPEAIAQAISAAGGRTNAGTIYSFTSYQAVLPKENAVKGIEIHADAIANPLFDAGELKKEAEVVIEESNRKLDNPGPVAFERMLATAFTQHRIKRWRIGSNEVLRNIRREDLVAFFDTLYRPENIVVTITGDIAPAEALAAVGRTFGAIPRGTLRKEHGPKEPPQTAFRFGRSESDIKEGYTVMGWHTVAEKHPDELTLEVLSGLLGTGRSSRLYRGAVGAQAASTVNSVHFSFEDVGIFSISATHPEANRAEVESRLVAEVERMKRHGPTEYELALAKNAAEVAFLGEMETALEQAETLSRYESRGSYREIAERLARLKSVTAEEVRDAARRYLTVEKLTLYHYQPKGAAAVDAPGALARIRAAAAVEVAAPSPLPVPVLANSVGPAGAAAPPRSFSLSNGATLVVQQRAGTPLVSTGFFFRGGRTQESAADAGITRLMQAVMRRGTGSRSAEAIDREIEFLGTQIGTQTWEDGFGFSFNTVTHFYEPALAIAADVLANPTFPADGLAREKALQVAALRRSLDSSTERPLQIFRAAAFPGHPYGLNDRGTEQTVASLDRAALEAWWRASVVADRALVVVVGNVDAEAVRRVMEDRLAKLPRSSAALRPLPAIAPPSSARESVEERDRRQTAMVIGFPAVAPSHPDWHGLRLLQAHTSGLSGTFFRQLRSRQSLAYTVFAGPQPYAQQSMFIGYLAGEASKEREARASMLAEMRKLQGDGIDPEDLARAKSFFLGSTRIGRESSGAIAAEYGRNYVLGVPLDNVDRTLAAVPGYSADDLRAVARRYLAGDNYVYAAVRGKAAAK
ncbi:MAG TPA: pitrilysin family protein [Usitatibacter sp.]|nr:pitrilysin family protein [Usitatibacter sp.]